MVSREDLKQLIDQAPEEALPFIQDTLRRWTPKRAAAATRLIARMEKGYDFGLNGQRPYRKRNDLHDR